MISTKQNLQLIAPNHHWREISVKLFFVAQPTVDPAPTTALAVWPHPMSNDLTTSLGSNCASHAPMIAPSSPKRNVVVVAAAVVLVAVVVAGRPHLYYYY